MNQINVLAEREKKRDGEEAEREWFVAFFKLPPEPKLEGKEMAVLSSSGY